ncbi:Cytolethal distending toxin A/C domain-containing protein [Streptomyces sp. cf386]|uniref:RICIN domain-containing protein n=1 Tax=Streptomyces sp. cf386 TaxID=1761904 RepID=UPI0008905C83|nr:hypothetical protein [Streptomyces sp. cf386]SDM98875.1 Cytolethal distending toxin A/C domain-containing protein [Streptomyces sp. cf386]
MKKLRLATVTALSTLAVGAGMIFPSSAQAATYWTFKNERFGTCLTAGDSGTAYATLCQGWNRQQWDWVGDGPGNFMQLKNRETGKCLVTDNKSDVNAVWLGTCNAVNGQWWYYAADTQGIFNNLGGPNDGHLRTSNNPDAVYATDAGQEPASYYTWTGTHN